MDRTPAPGEKRPALRPEQTELAQFPCGFDQDDIAGDPKPCGGDCPAVEFDRPCPFLIVYKKALAYKRCARLLRVVDARFLARIEGVFRYVTMWPSAIEAAEHWRAAIRKALREAGL